MDKTEKSLRLRSKIWIANSEGEVVFGLGRLRMLEAIEQHGSIQRAAKSLGMSYRAMWGRIRATEQRLGKPLLIRSIGGASGGGSELTPFARELVRTFQRLHRQVLAQSDALYADMLEPCLKTETASDPPEDG